MGVQTYRTEGFWALYRGFIPNWLRLGPWNIIVSFYFYFTHVTCVNLKLVADGPIMKTIFSAIYCARAFLVLLV